MVAEPVLHVNAMHEYVAAQKDVTAGYKRMDTAIAAAVMDELGYSIPALFSYTDPANGDRYSINITARANLIERGKPREAPA